MSTLLILDLVTFHNLLSRIQQEYVKVCEGHCITGMLHASCSRSSLNYTIFLSSLPLHYRVLQMDVDVNSHEFTDTDEAESQNQEGEAEISPATRL